MARKNHRYQEGLAGNDIHRLVRVTAYHVLVHEDRSVDGSTQQPRSVTVVTDLGLRSDPNLHRAQSGPFRVRIEARQPWVAAARLLESTYALGTLIRKDVSESRNNVETGRSFWRSRGMP